MTLRDRLLAGEHHGCASWAEVARKMKVDERHLRVVRKTLAAEGKAVELRGQEIPEFDGTNYPTSSAAAKWPSVEAFDRETSTPTYSSRIWLPGDFRNPEALPYVPPASPKIRKLTRDECPDGTVILWASDIHIPIHNVLACDLMMECAERIGVSLAILGGDGLDFNCLSRHKKKAHRVVQHATLLEEIEPGRPLLNWFARKNTKYLLGNHEMRLESFIDENPVFHGSLLSNFAKVVELPSNIEVIPQDGEVRLGNLSWQHGHSVLKGGSGGKYPAQRVLDALPDQSTMIGHVHRQGQACRTTRDEDGIQRTRRAWTMGHMSNEYDHYEYMSTSPNWQTGFGIIRAFWEDDRPRFSVYQVEVLFDRHNRPYFEFGGHVYSAARKVAA